jgi:hypothetical protein
MDGIESIIQEANDDLARIYKQLLRDIDSASPTQIERILTQNEIAKVIFLRDSLVQKVRSRAADYFKENLGSVKAVNLSGSIDEEFPRPDIPAISVTEIQRRLRAVQSARTVAPTGMGVTSASSQGPSQPQPASEDFQLLVGIIMGIAGGVVALLFGIKLLTEMISPSGAQGQTSAFTLGGGITAAAGCFTYSDAVNRKKSGGKIEHPASASSQPAQVSAVAATMPTHEEIQQSVKVLLACRQDEVSQSLAQMIKSLFQMVDRMMAEERGNA